MTVHDSSYPLPLPELKVSPAPSIAGWVCPMDPSVVAADQPPEIVPVKASAMVVDDGQPQAAKGAPQAAADQPQADGQMVPVSPAPESELAEDLLHPLLLESITERELAAHGERHRPVSGGTEASPSMTSWACPTNASAVESSHAG